MTIEVGEMREFFAKVVDKVNELSAQAGLVSGLQEQVNQLAERLNQLEQANADLKNKLEYAQSQLQVVEQDLQGERENHQRAIEHAEALRNTIVEADARVVDLTNKLDNEQDSHRITTANLEDSRLAVTELENDRDELKDMLADTKAELSKARESEYDWERRYREAQRQLDVIRGVVVPAVVVSPIPDVA